jgi:DNA-binding NarL/FixJ family response regulator
MFAVSSGRERLLPPEELQVAIGMTYVFASYFHEWFCQKLRRHVTAANPPPAGLTKREREVLGLAAHGHSSKIIGHELGIAEGTVNYYIKAIKRKLNVRTRSHAVARAVHAGLIR